MTRRYTWMILFLSLAVVMLQASCGDDDNGTSSTTTVPGESWVIRATGTSNYLMDVACSDSRIAAAGQGGTFMTSTNGVFWEQHDSITSTYMYGVEWIVDRFVAVGDSSRIWISTDGIDWEQADSVEESENWTYGVGGNSEIMLAVGQSGLILHSTDQGHHWYLPDSTVDDLATSANLHAVAWSEELGLFVAVGGGGTIITSADGRVWTLAASSLNAWLYDVIWAPEAGVFVVVGQDGHILSSPDGKIWSVRESRLGAYLFDVAYSGSRFVAVGANGLVLSSDDAYTWTLRGSDYTQHLRGVVWSETEQMFVAVGLGQAVRTSPDGITWTTQFDGLDVDLYGVTYLPTEDTLCLAAGSHGTILAARGGLNWRLAFSGLEYTLYDIANMGTDKIVAVGDQGTVLSSTDGGDHWTANNPTANTFLGVAAVDNSFVAVGRNGTIYTTTDLTVWYQQVGGGEEHLNDVVSHGDKVIAVGENGSMVEASATDLSSWSPVAFPVDTVDLRAIKWIDSIYVTVGSYGSIFTSPDGSTWTQQEWTVDAVEDLVQLNGIAASDNRFVGVGVGLNIVLSSDGGQTYTRQVYSGSGSLEDVVWTGSRFVGVGWGNAIFTSP